MSRERVRWNGSMSLRPRYSSYGGAAAERSRLTLRS